MVEKCRDPADRLFGGSDVSTMLEPFDSVRIINLAHRADRRREMVEQLQRVGASNDARLTFFTAERPADAGAFPSVGARGCFESHLSIVREALAQGVDRLLIMEDDLDFSADIDRRGHVVMAALAARPWDIFYGVAVLDVADNRSIAPDEQGLAALTPQMGVQTASCVAFGRPALTLLEPFLTAMLARPAGSPDYGPMHVDGAYSIFRRQFPQLRTLACVPAIGGQRASRSDISENRFMLDRLAVTRPLANWLRRSLAPFRR